VRDADHEQICARKSAAQVHAKGRKIKLTDRRALARIAGGKAKAQDYDMLRYEDDFFSWNALRSGYLSEASVEEARVYIGPGPGWYDPGWYGMGWNWDPWFGVWTLFPAEGIFYSPFGWGGF
jgi:hypothetical protein